jgi:hypothetical protein
MDMSVPQITPDVCPIIQRFDNLFDPTPSADVPLLDALSAIANGTYVQAIAEVRAVFATEGEDAYCAAKRRLPQFTFAGTFTPTRAKEHLALASGICHADIDHLTDLDDTKRRLMDDPHVVYCFTSPRGDGLKYGVRIPRVDSDKTYKHAWDILAAAHLAAYGVIWDPSGKDISRLCFVSWDPTCYVNPEAQVYDVPPPIMITPAPTPRPAYATTMPRDRRERYAQRGIANAIRLIEESSEGHRHEARRKAGYLLGGYVGGGVLSHDEAYEALRAAVEGHTKHLKPSLKTIRDCLKAGEREPITETELEDDWQRWKDAHPLAPRTQTSLTDADDPLPALDDDPLRRASVLAHRLPDHLRNHPDPRVRQHWARVYRKANAYKQRLLNDPYARVFPGTSEGR